ncbi:MAG: polyhydroxyalkanoic acid system family protein [Sandaracinaceae bacterium]|nr:polyhydroxyalkanoic acid system family protein [Sandaracinaceae bacterium]
MKHQIHHGLELPLAKKAIAKAMEAYSARFSEYNPFFNWVTENKGEVGFSAKGMKLEGEIEIIGPEVYVDLDVPFVFRIFKGRAMEIIDREVRAWVEKAKNGEV